MVLGVLVCAFFLWLRYLDKAPKGRAKTAKLPTMHAPKSDTAKNLVPTVPAVTTGTAYVRFHGRNLGTWNKRGGSAAERFDYLYSDEELAEWTGTLKELAGQSEQAYAFFNNNASSADPDNPLGRISQAATNARQLRRLLDVNDIPATGWSAA